MSRASHFRLIGEQLEGRFALSTLLGGVEPLPTINPVAPTGTEVSLPEANPPPTDPPTVDPPPPAVAPPESTNPPNTAPIILDLTLTIVDNWCTLRGRVSDDHDPTGYLVALTGVINQTLSVGIDDFFTYEFQFDSELHGPVFVQTQDMYGLLSNEPFVNI